MVKHLKTLYEYRELLWVWTVRDIKVRYRQSILGAAWAIFQPLAMMLIFSAVFTFLARIPTDGIPYPIFYYSALLPWTFMTAAISYGVPSVVNNMNLVTKIYFPREILPFSAVLASFLDLLVASTVFIGLVLYYRLPLSLSLLFVPLILLILGLLTAGVVLFAAAVNVFYRDVRFVVPLGLQLWLYATPIIYPTSIIPGRLRPYYMLNPAAGIIDSFRRVILQGTSPVWGYLGLSAAISLALFIGGFLYFKRAEATFADFI